MVIKAPTGGTRNESLMEFAWEASAYTAHVNLLVDLPDSSVFFFFDIRYSSLVRLES